MLLRVCSAALHCTAGSLCVLVASSTSGTTMTPGAETSSLYSRCMRAVAPAATPAPHQRTGHSPSSGWLLCVVCYCCAAMSRLCAVRLS
jgi:hypothetical protein